MNIFKNRMLVGVFCIVLSLLICFGLTPLFNKGISQKTEIIRVAKEIKTGDAITEGMVRTVEVGQYNLPENVIKLKENVIGTYALADLSIGDYILSTKVSRTPAEENAYLYHLDGSKQAISITIKNFANGLSGKLQSGDIVSVIAPDYKKQGVTVIPPELKYVEVVSVTASSGYDANTGEKDSNTEEKELPSTATLLVTPEQGNLLADLEADGKCHLSLVYRGDESNAEKFLDMQQKIIDELYPPRQSASDNTAQDLKAVEVAEETTEQTKEQSTKQTTKQTTEQASQKDSVAESASSREE